MVGSEGVLARLVLRMRGFSLTLAFDVVRYGMDFMKSYIFYKAFLWSWSVCEVSWLG